MAPYAGVWPAARRPVDPHPDLAAAVARWRLPEVGLTLYGFFGRHDLPPRAIDAYVSILSQITAGQCVQVLYDRRFPVPRVYSLLERQCESLADRGALRLFRCPRPIRP